jgi:SAM-dependent methyltransferase
MTKSSKRAPLNPYDEFPYGAYPISWTAPERLALASLLHGGPRLNLDHYRVLELGCANGANLLPMAWYRRHADFTGLDASARQLALADDARQQLGLSNLQFVHGDFASAADRLDGPYDIIMAHGVFSWVTDGQRDAMLELCASKLAPNGLLYQNYNAMPGWKVRGMVRDYLMKMTARVPGLKARAEMCKTISAAIVLPLQQEQHPFTRLMCNEFQLVVNQETSYIAHEYLSPENRAYWRDEFFSLLGQYGFAYVADADFNCASNRITTEVAGHFSGTGLTDIDPGDVADLICYRQMQSPVLTRAPLQRQACSKTEFAELYMASSLVPAEDETGENPSFKHASGQEIETCNSSIHQALLKLQTLWPRGLRIRELFDDIDDVREDIELLLRYQLIELRCIEPGDFEPSPQPLNTLEQSLRKISTTPWHSTDR